MSATHIRKILPERPRELQDWQNYYVYHPLSRRIAAVCVATPITPNMLSVAGGIVVVLAAAVYWQQAGFVGALCGMALHMCWHIVDGADGDLARMTGRSSSKGEVIDGICDYVGHIVMYVMLAMLLSIQIGVAAWPLMVAAGVARIIQTVHYETQRRQYQWWVYGKSWLRVAKTQERGGDERVGTLGSRYLSLSRLLAPNGERIDGLLADAADLSRLRRQIRAEMQSVLRGLPLLGSNYRTLALGASMLAGSALYFFIYEAALLWIVLAVSVRNCRRATARILNQASQSTLR